MTTSVTETYELHVTGAASLTVHSHAGNITLHTGRDEHIVVAATKRVQGFLGVAGGADLEKVQIGIQQSGNHISVDAAPDRWSLFKKVAVDLDITLPVNMARLDLTLH